MNRLFAALQSMKLGGTSWCATLALLAFAPAAVYAGDQCTVNDAVMGVPDGIAKYLGRGPVRLTSPQVRVITVRRHAASAAAGSVATSGVVAGTAPGARHAPRPARTAPKNDQERLFTAAFDGDIAEVERQLRSAAVDVNAPVRSDSRRSLIDVAAAGAWPQVAHALIAHGARVRGPVDAVDVQPIAAAMINLKSTIQMHGNPAAFAWSRERSPQDFEATIQVLLAAGADADGILDPTHPDSALGLLLTTPRFEGDMRIARLLLDHGAHLGAATPGGSPLAIAVANGRDEFLALALVAPQMDSSALDAALAPAVARQDAGIVSKLLTAGASPDAHDPYDHSLLCATLMGGQQSRSLAVLFVRRGARPAVDCVGGPPLNLAMGDRELAILLLDHGADPSRADRNGATALNLAPDTDHELIDVLLLHGATLALPISDRGLDGMLDAAGTQAGATLRALLYQRDYLATGLLRRDGLQGASPCAAVLYATAVGAHGTLAELLRHGADPDSMTQRGTTALMAAAYHSDAQSLRMLLEQPQIRVDRATPTVYNSGTFALYSENAPPLRSGHRTALMYAAAAGHAEGCKLLLEHGASTREKDAEGLTALEYASNEAVRGELQAARDLR